MLGDRARRRFQLSDAQYVLAREAGYPSWAELKRTMAKSPDGPVGADAKPADTGRTESTVLTDLEYRPGDPVRVRVVRREHRILVTDDGGAIARAGHPRAWRPAAHRVEEELMVNFSRDGAISLPVVRVGPPEAEVVRRIAAASLAFYQELLDLLQPQLPSQPRFAPQLPSRRRV